MSADKRWRLVCYDIRDPSRWRKVYKVVRGRGTRVQYSVFRCRLDQRDVERLRWELSLVMAPEDALLIVDLCPSCAANVISRNHVDGWQEHVASFRVIGPGAPRADHAPADDQADDAGASAQPLGAATDPTDVTTE
jgi:CRISPR-associated protein Cas2